MLVCLRLAIAAPLFAQEPGDAGPGPVGAAQGSSPSRTDSAPRPSSQSNVPRTRPGNDRGRSEEIGGSTGDGGAASSAVPGGEGGRSSIAPPGLGPGGAVSDGALGADPFGGAGAVASPSSGLGGVVSGGGGGYFPMIGDMGPFSIHQLATVPGGPVLPQPFPPNSPPRLPNPNSRSLLNPTVRGFKIADNQSPFPQDRIYYSFNYFSDVNEHLNRVFETPYDHLRVDRSVFGVEKTFAQGNGSIGLRLPLNTASAEARAGQLRSQGGTSTALGDLTPYLKYVIAYDPRRNNLASVGLAVTPPTGPATFAGAPFLRQTPRAYHTTTVQPFFGYYLTFGKLFLQGFEAIDVPQNYNLPTIIYSDAALGYFLYQDRSPGRWLTAVVPTFEVHVTTPINHRDAYSLFDKGATPDVVNLTSGVNFEIRSRGVLTFGVAAPVTDPRPFGVEAIALLNFRFGAPRRSQTATPFLGG